MHVKSSADYNVGKSSSVVREGPVSKPMGAASAPVGGRIVIARPVLLQSRFDVAFAAGLGVAAEAVLGEKVVENAAVGVAVAPKPYAASQTIARAMRARHCSQPNAAEAALLRLCDFGGKVIWGTTSRT
jgi:hypothetical protein